jgi:hypothetical protein
MPLAPPLVAACGVVLTVMDSSLYRWSGSSFTFPYGGVPLVLPGFLCARVLVSAWEKQLPPPAGFAGLLGLD